MNRIKVQFLGGSWRIIEFDQMHVNGPFVIFNLGDETVLTAVTRNMTFFEPAPEETSRKDDQLALDLPNAHRQCSQQLSTTPAPGCERRK